MFEDEEESIKAHEELPIYKKAQEIYEMVSKIADLITDDDESTLSSIKGQILNDSMLILVKIAGAEGGDIYDIRMENAAIIRKSARDLMVSKHTLETFGFEEYAYFDMVRELIEEFRLLFIDWVAGFDQSNYIIDRWGLFNPHGVGPFDKDLDDDIPFDPEDLLDEED